MARRIQWGRNLEADDLGHRFATVGSAADGSARVRHVGARSRRMGSQLMTTVYLQPPRDMPLSLLTDLN